MRKLLIISAVAASLGGSALADCVNKDHAIYCEDGTSSIIIGGVEFFSNGDIARRDDNVVSIYNGETGALKGKLIGRGNQIFNGQGALVGTRDGHGSTTWTDGTTTTRSEHGSVTRPTAR